MTLRKAVNTKMTLFIFNGKKNNQNISERRGATIKSKESFHLYTKKG